MDILLGLFLVMFGLVITFFGLAVFFTTLPLLGFLFGVFVGAAGVEALFGHGFLGSVASWLVGFAVGLLFGFLAWYWWYAGALLSAGVLGAALGTGLVRLFGGSSEWLLVVFGVAGFVLLVVVALVLNLPTYVVIVNTAVAGATVLVSGVLLVFNQVDHGEMGRGTAVAIINESWWWVLVVAVFSVIGILFQMTMRTALALPPDRWITGSQAVKRQSA
jgi:hypothetical protein